ncbi:hypothetical protein H2203_007992 [Taxawa tesnikishii (nom. ined.)]|nr:hypothetical protein H2203_007992 [Dothideales sp. JES 119]
MCGVKLDGWEPGDVPLLEHLAHSSGCGWALSLSVVREDEDRDPMSEDMIEARRATYATLWPHESKKGWKCKTQKMIEAGWSYDPGPEAEDGVTCFYCNLSLDGWEPKDNPMDEHAKRSPDCPFFALVEQYAAAAAAVKPSAKSKKGRLSRVSKGSRLSTQSIMSTFSEAPSMMSLGDAGMDHDMAMEDSVAVDDSVATVATNASTTGKSRKKGGKAKTTTKGKKKAAREEIVESTVTYPSLIETTSQSPKHEEPVIPSPPPAPVEAPPVSVEIVPKTRGRKAKGKAAEDSQIEGSSMMDQAPKAKKGRGRPKKASVAPDHPDESQLQSELDTAASFADGAEKTESSEILAVEEPARLKKKPGGPALKGKKGKKAAKETREESQADTMEIEPTAEEESAAITMQEEPTESTPPQPKRKRGRPSKQAQRVSAVESPSAISVPIEEELEPERAEPTPAASEFEPTPTPQKPRSSHISIPPATQDQPSPIDLPSPASESAHSTPAAHAASNPPTPKITLHPRPNVPPPLANTKALFPQPHSILTSPTKTTTVALAASTPNRSPQRRPASPSKILAQLTSTVPWAAADLETVFFPSPEKENESADVAARLLETGGKLSSPEKEMSVEEWVRWRADKGEERLRQECERMVSLFEAQAARAQASLGAFRSFSEWEGLGELTWGLGEVCVWLDRVNECGVGKWLDAWFGTLG